MLLHVNARYCIEYSTKLFEKKNSLPFWEEKQTQTLKPNTESAIVAVIDLKEMKDNVISKVEFNGVICYKKSEKECILPIDKVMLSPLDTIEERFDVLCSNPMG